MSDPENKFGEEVSQESPAESSKPAEDVSAEGADGEVGHAGNVHEQVAPAEAESRPRRSRRDPRRDPPGRPGASGAQQVTMNFNAGFDASGAVFGVSGGGGKQRPAGRVTGRLSPAEVATVVTHYAAPECFAPTAKRLERERVVVIEGKPGMGRRAGAIALLEKVGAAPLYLLPPSITLRELAERNYDEGRGYLIVDRFSERNSNVADFSWSTVQDRVRDAEAYLIVTTGIGVRGVPHVAWERPPADEVLHAQLAGRGIDDEEARRKIGSITGSLPEEVSLAGLAGVAELIATGREPAEALASLRDNAADEVRAWFAEDPEDRKILEITALCFFERVDVRSFEYALDRLVSVMVKRLPGKYRKTLLKPENRPLATRGRRVSLMRVKEVAADVGTATIVVFKDEEYHRSVLAELWRTQDNVFWDGVAEWLDEIVTDGDSLPVAYGLSGLACSAFEEVNETYLQPWSRGKVGIYGQFTAIYALWYLCQGDLAPVALQAAVGWATERDLDQRWSAVVAFGGLLGRAYPVEAVNQLWRQMSAHGDLLPTARAALAQLFATLTEDPNGDAKAVLALLEPKIRKYVLGIGAERTHADELMRLRNLVLTATLAVLEARSIDTGQPAMVRYLARYLSDQPERLDLVARIWAGLLRHRPHRRQAIVALRGCLRALREVSDTPQEDARLIGGALARALPATEHRAFRRDFQIVNQQLNRGQKDLSADVLLACLNAISLTLPGETA